MSSIKAAMKELKELREDLQRMERQQDQMEDRIDDNVARVLRYGAAQDKIATKVNATDKMVGRLHRRACDLKSMTMCTSAAVEMLEGWASNRPLVPYKRKSNPKVSHTMLIELIDLQRKQDATKNKMALAALEREQRKKDAASAMRLLEDGSPVAGLVVQEKLVEMVTTSSSSPSSTADTAPMSDAVMGERIHIENALSCYAQTQEMKSGRMIEKARSMLKKEFEESLKSTKLAVFRKMEKEVEDLEERTDWKWHTAKESFELLVGRIVEQIAEVVREKDATDVWNEIGPKPVWINANSCSGCLKDKVAEYGLTICAHVGLCKGCVLICVEKSSFPVKCPLCLQTGRTFKYYGKKPEEEGIVAKQAEGNGANEEEEGGPNEAEENGA